MFTAKPDADMPALADGVDGWIERHRAIGDFARFTYSLHHTARHAGGLERRRQPCRQLVVTTERMRHADVTREHRAEREHDQHECHGRGGVVKVRGARVRGREGARDRPVQGRVAPSLVAPSHRAPSHFAL